ncbi:MAG TPA: hypothetical protein VFU21_00895 [Kofleriaceae bacterium]|nr:hypothetical protein [Kofleriaceae bacterium]
MRGLCVLGLVAACGGGAGGGQVARLRPACAAGSLWDGARCARAGGQTERELAAVDAELEQGELDAALARVRAALTRGPHPWELYVRLVEKVAVVESFLEREPEALATFDLLLALDPIHVLSYETSPKATRTFEKARKAAGARPAPEVQVSWPYDLEVSRPVPISVEVVADPRQFLARATLFSRRRGDAAFSAVDLRLPARGRHRSIRLPALDTGKPEALEVYLSAFDRRGNEVLRWAGPAEPRVIALAHDPETPWYRTWWVWASVGAAAAIATGIVVFVATDDPPDLLDGTVGY